MKQSGSIRLFETLKRFLVFDGYSLHHLKSHTTGGDDDENVNDNYTGHNPARGQPAARRLPVAAASTPGRRGKLNEECRTRWGSCPAFLFLALPEDPASVAATVIASSVFGSDASLSKQTT